MRTLLAGLVLLTLAGISPAAEPTARERIERILTDPAADLTAEVNALIAMGPDRVRPVLDELFVRMRNKHSAASGYRAEAESLVAVLAGTDESYEPPIWDLGARFGVLNGVVVLLSNAPNGGGWSGNLHYSWVPPKDPLRPIDDAWRKPLVPGPKALLARILDPDKELKEQFTGWYFPRSAACALGTAARDDAELATRLVGAYRSRDDDRSTVRMLADALGWLGTPEAIEALIDALDRYLRDGSHAACWQAGQMPDAVRRAGGADAMARLRAKFAKEDPKALAAFDDVVGGDPTDRPLLARVVAEPTPESIAALHGRMARFSSWVRWPEPDVILASFRVGHDLMRDGPEELRGPASELVGSILRVDTSGAVQAGIARIARMVSDDLAAGRLLPRSCPGPAWGPFDDVVDTEDARDREWGWNLDRRYAADPGYGRFVECGLRREEDEIAVTIRNAGDRTLCVNRVGLKYGETQGGPGDDFLRIDLGRPPIDDLAAVPASAFEAIGPGEMYTFRLPLPEGIPDDARIIVAFRDGFVLDGELPGIRLGAFEREFELVPATPEGADLVVRPVDRRGIPVLDAMILLYAEPIAAGWSRHQGSVLLPREEFPEEDRYGEPAAGASRFVHRLGTGLWRLVVKAPGRPPTERMLASAWGATPGEIEVVMESAVRLSGRVLLDGETPLADVEVAAVRVGTSITPSSPAFDFRALTDWGGRYRIEEMAAGDYDLFTRRKGSAWLPGPRVRLPGIDRFDIEVTDGAEITGVVTERGETGRPIPGATVELLPDGPGEAMLDQAETDEDGRYVLRSQRRFVAFSGIRVRAEGHARRVVPGPDGTVLRAGDRHTTDIALGPAASIGGQVATPRGYMAGTEVRVWIRSDSGYHPDLDRYEAVVTETDDLGRWSVGGLAPGRVAVQVVRDGFLHSGWEDATTSPRMRFPLGYFPKSSVRTLTVGENDDFDVEMTALRPDARTHHSFRGIVVDGNGRPVPLARIVESGGEETLSDVEGAFEVAGFGKLTVTVSKVGYSRAWTAKEPGESVDAESNRIVLVRRPVLRGRVVSKTGGSVVGAKVHVGRLLLRKMGYRHADWEIVPGGRVAADGTFAIPVPALEIYQTPWSSEYRDEYVVCVEADDHAAGISAPFSLGEKPRDHTIAKPVALDAGPSLEGIALHYRTDAPAAGVAVLLEAEEGAWNVEGWPPAAPPSPGRICRAVTGEDGRFRIPHLVPGRYRVELLRAGRAGDAAVVTLPAKKPVRLHVRTLHPVAGIVFGPKSDPLPGATVALEDEDGDLIPHPPPVVTGPDGRFRFARVPAGPWHLVVTTDAALGPRRVGPVPAGKTDIAIALPRPRRITGRLIDPEGRPMKDVDILAKPVHASLPWVSAWTDRDGRFELWPLGESACDVEFIDLDVTVRGVPSDGRLEYRSRGTKRISGRVLGPPEAEDLGWPTLRLVPMFAEPDPRVLRHPSSYVDWTGKFTFDHLPPGRYRIEVHEDDRRQWRLVENPVIEAGATDVEVWVRLRRGD